MQDGFSRFHRPELKLERKQRSERIIDSYLSSPSGSIVPVFKEVGDMERRSVAYTAGALYLFAHVNVLMCDDYA